MKESIIRLFFIVLVLCFCSACQEEEEYLPQGGITLSLSEEKLHVDTRAVPSELVTFSAKDFNVKIEDEGNNKVLYHGSFTDEMVSLPPSTYRVKAYWGENVLLGLDSPYFEGMVEGVKVASKENKSVNVLCKVANALLSVRYVNPSVFDELYSHYAVMVKNGNASVRIEDVSKSAYFRAGAEISIFFEAILKTDGHRVEIPLTHMELPKITKAGQHIILSLKASNVCPEISKVDVREAMVSGQIPVSWLPKPKLEVVGFDNNQLTIVETESKTAQVNFKMSMPLEELKLRFGFEDSRFLELNDRDFFLSHEEDRKLLEQTLGLALPKIGDEIAGLDFSNLISKVQTNGGATTNNHVIIDVKANHRWSSEDQTVCRDFNIQCVKPRFSVTCFPGNVWTKEFVINPLTAANVASGNFEKIQSDLVYQFSKDNVEWTDYQQGIFLQKNLNPGTKYYVRAKYRQAVNSEVLEVRTNDVDRSLDTGFETWSADKFSNWSRWFLNANKDWKTEGWCSLNYFTSGNNNIFAYCSNSGTEPSKDCYSGTYSAEIKTIGWGSGNSAAGGISVIYNITPGEVFLGKIDESFNPVYGYHQYKSRPTGIRFFYKYYPKGTHKFRVEIALLSETEVVAKNEFEAGAINNFTEQLLNFVYDPGYVEKEVTGIKVRFISGDNSYGELDKGSIRASARHTGNKLYIDDFSLIYDK